MSMNYSGPICCLTPRTESWICTTDNKLTRVFVITAEMKSQACISHEQAPLLQRATPDVVRAGINFLPLNVEGFSKNKDIVFEQLFAFLKPKPIAILLQKTHVQDVNKLKIAGHNPATYSIYQWQYSWSCKKLCRRFICDVLSAAPPSCEKCNTTRLQE